ncbi:MAG: hypothetical protein JXR96_20210 [Deltaproteobacteria bacterium]|nr:hypothetical protein [Deltaproteobacteria bacterium]
MARMLALNVEKALGADAHDKLEPAERDAILEIAYMAIAADGKLMESELDAFTEAMLLLYGPQATPEKVKQLVDHLVATFEHDANDDLREFTSELERPYARRTAYKLAYAMAMSDLDTNDSEFEFDQKLRCMLGLSEDEAEALADEVIEAIRPGGRPAI